MKTRKLWVVALFLLACTAGIANAVDPVPLSEATGPWLGLLRSENPALRTAAGAALADIVRKHPTVARDLVRSMADEGDASVIAEHERRLVALAKESPATVSALIRLIRELESNYRARNFGVKVLSQVGPAAATPEFVEALAETHCPVPGAFLRVMRSLGKNATPILTAGFRHANPTIRNRAAIGLRVLGRTDPAIQKLFDALQAEPPLVQKLREGAFCERIVAVTVLAELARTTPGTATILVNALKDISDKDVLVEAEGRLIALGRESPEVVAALVAAVRSEDDYHLRKLALKVLPKVGATLNCKETVEALGDDSCPVPGAMRRILLAAGPDALPVLSAALKHGNPEIRRAAENILQRMPRPAAVVGAIPKP
jgi:HEAT repeat protein